MKPAPDNQPAVLNYATATDRPGWPVGIYIGALLWAFATLRLVSIRLIKGPRDAELAAIELRSQLLWLALPAARLAWAVFRKDRNRWWVVYVVLLGLAAPLWVMLREIGYWLGR